MMMMMMVGLGVVVAAMGRDWEGIGVMSWGEVMSVCSGRCRPAKVVRFGNGAS